MNRIESAPTKIILITNYTCNLNCIYCDVKSLHKKYMTVDELKSMVYDLNKLGIKQIEIIGGEPFFNPNLIPLLSHCKKLHIETIVHSNSHIVTNFSENSLKYIDTFITCINGTSDIHDLIRGIKGNYERTLKTIELMVQLGITVVVDMILSRINFEFNYIDHVVSLSEKLNFKINFQKVFEHNLVSCKNNVSIKKLSINEKQRKECFEYILTNVKPNLLFNSFEYFQDMICSGASRFENCYMGKFSCVIDPLGNISKCYKYLRKKENPNGLIMGWNNAIKKIPDSESCYSCEYSSHIEDNYFYMKN